MTTNYSFQTLLPADFEDLSRELIGAEMQIRFEAFAAGPDGGQDGRHSKSGFSTILQAKHYVNSTFSQLIGAMKKEYKSINSLKPNRYIISTSQSLTPHRKSKIEDILHPWIINTSDIYGCEDLNLLIRAHPKIERSHIKLWLSSTSVLNKLLKSSIYNRTATTMNEISQKIKIYATNPSFEIARRKLEDRRILIISGPPGVGKTTLAEMMANLYIQDDWELIFIRSLDDGFSTINDKEKQIFFFDDFLGRIALDERALAASESDLTRFINRIRGSKNARFVLTTRAYLLEDARRISEQLSDPKIKISTYILDVGIYTRKIRARILYNHLAIGSTPKSYIVALIKSGKIASIVDHPNYNPRVVEWMTDHINMTDIPAHEYADEFLLNLKNPQRLWDAAFRNHIVARCRHLLYCLYFGSQYGVEIAELRSTFEPLHRIICGEHSIQSGPKDFEEALRVLEGGFVNITNSTVNFINPSLRDYMSGYLSDSGILLSCAVASVSADWAASVWQQASNRHTRFRTKKLANSFLPIAQTFLANHKGELSATRRVELLLEWYDCSGSENFLNIANDLLSNTSGVFKSTYDLSSISTLIDDMRSYGYSIEDNRKSVLIGLMVGQLINMIENNPSLDELNELSDKISESYFGKDLDSRILAPLNSAIRLEIESLKSTIDQIDSESTLEEYIDYIRKLGPIASVPNTISRQLIEHAEERIGHLEYESRSATPPDPTDQSHSTGNEFTNLDLKNLFDSLS